MAHTSDRYGNYRQEFSRATLRQEPNFPKAKRLGLDFSYLSDNTCVMIPKLGRGTQLTWEEAHYVVRRLTNEFSFGKRKIW